jgi:hypothetical protein
MLIEQVARQADFNAETGGRSVDAGSMASLTPGICHPEGTA